MSILPKKDKPITFRIDDETYEKIEELVKQNKTSVSLEIRKMIDFYLESKESNWMTNHISPKKEYNTTSL